MKCFLHSKDLKISNPLYLNRLISEDGRFTTVVIKTDSYSNLGGDVDVLVIFGAEPGADFGDVDTTKYDFVIGCSPYRSKALEKVCDVLLPIGTFAETAGTYVNCEGRWQSLYRSRICRRE